MTTEIFQGMDENAGSCEGMTGSNFTQTTLCVCLPRKYNDEVFLK